MKTTLLGLACALSVAGCSVAGADIDGGPDVLGMACVGLGGALLGLVVERRRRRAALQESLPERMRDTR